MEVDLLDIALVSHTELRPWWRAALRPGDVVHYRFPFPDAVRSRPIPRPCLVLEVETLLGQRYALLAPGTAAGEDRPGPHGLQLEGAAVAAAGLRQPTRFLGGNRLLVPLDSRGFGTAPSPILGRLDEPCIARLNALRARLHAERDIAADRRAERRRQVRHASIPRRTVTVETRRPKRRGLQPGRCA